jgi:hypothetical protein
MANSIERAPKSEAALFREKGPAEATIADCELGSGLVSRYGVCTPLTAAFNCSALAVKFCLIIRLPPNSAMAIMRSGPAVFSIKVLAALRAWI